MSDIFSIVIFVIAYIFIASEKFNRVAVALFGAAAMVIVGATNAAKKAGIHISFWQFAKYRIPVTFLSVIMIVPYVLLRYL